MPKGHPEGLYVLFMVEMWERFSYYGMRALLTLYMLKMLLYGQKEAFGIYGAYGSLVYLTPLLGGWLADNFLGYRRAIFTGGILMAVGMFLLTLNQEFTFYIALGCIILGNGFFKPNISSMVGRLYEDGDPRRDSGFSIFYMGINLGAFLAPIGCTLVGDVFGSQYGFGLAGVGMIFGLLMFWRKIQIFGDNGTPPNPQFLQKTSIIGLPWGTAIPLLAVLLIPVLVVLVQYHEIVSAVVPIIFFCFVAYLLFYTSSRGGVLFQRMWVIVILVLFSTLFWSFFELAGSALTVYADVNVDRGSIPAELFQAVNAGFILIFVPIFNQLWAFLRPKGLEPNTPIKFGLGLIQLGLGFYAFVVGAAFADANGLVPVMVLLIGYLLQTTGEICLSPVGLSMVTKLAPQAIVGMVMGFWFLSSSLAHNVSGLLAQLTSVGGEPIYYANFTPIYEKMKAAASTGDSFTVYAVDNATGKPTDSVNVKIQLGSTAHNPVKVPFQRFVSSKPGQPVAFNLHFPLLDKDGSHSRFATVSNGKRGKLAIAGNQGTYTPDSSFTGQDTVLYALCDTRADHLCDTLQVVVTVSDAAQHTPKAIQPELTVPVTEKQKVPNAYGLELSFLAYPVYSGVSLPHNMLFYDPDHDSNPQSKGFKLKVAELSEAEKARKTGIIQVKGVDDPRLSARRTLLIYNDVFQLIAYIAMGIGVLLLVISPVIKKWMHEDKPSA
jgi:POT family proton-dependent oligopeptide transporter